jgi:hypothetical protein
MTSRKGGVSPTSPTHRRTDRIKDEVYRQMFRLEAGYPGAEMGLALALLRAWIDMGSRSEVSEQEWLTKISPICLVMIETSLDRGATSNPCLQ